MPVPSAAVRGKARTATPATEAAAARLPLPENRPFKMYVDPLVVWFHEGECLYRPIEVPVGAGLNNTAVDGDHTHVDALQKKLGRTEIPGDVAVVAWGEKERGYLAELDIGADANGKPMKHYHSVFTRYVPRGRLLVPEFDRAGWIAFCRDLKKLMGGPPDKQTADGERHRVRAQIDVHRRIAHASPSSAASMEVLEASLKSPGDATA